MNIRKQRFLLISFVFHIIISYACVSAEDDNIRSRPIDVRTTEQLCSHSKELSNSIQEKFPSFSKNFNLKEVNEYERLISGLKSDQLSIIHHSISKILVFFAKKQDIFRSLITETMSLTLLKDNIASRPLHMFQNKALVYFSSYFKDNFKSIEFIEKTAGRQLGNKLIIRLNDEQEIVYYSKTHGKGLSSDSSKSSSAKPVNPKEVFMYKYLELTNVGQEVHFFYDDISNFYIATKGTDYNGFKTYCQLKNEEEVLKKDFEEKDEIKINSIISNGLVKADIISRVFQLTDLVSNDGNIGFTYIDGKIHDFKIVDFDIYDNISYENTDIYKGFLSGNGVHNYAFAADSITRYYLCKRNIQKRIKTAKEIVSSILVNNLVDQSYNFVSDYFSSHQIDLDVSASALEDLNKYTFSIKKNMEIFLTELG